MIDYSNISTIFIDIALASELRDCWRAVYCIECVDVKWIEGAAR